MTMPRHWLDQATRLGAPMLLVFILGLVAAPSVAKEVPFHSGYVTDLAAIVPTGMRAQIEERLAAFETASGHQIAVLTIDSLDGDSLEDFSFRVASTWQLGRAGVDDGVLLLIAVKERRMRIEVGYGLEGDLTDAQSRRVLDNVIQPYFRSGDFGVGIEEGVKAIIATLGQPGVSPQPIEETAPAREVPPLGCVLAILMGVIALIILSIVFDVFLKAIGAKKGRGWSSKGGWEPSFPTGGWGGFGGSSGGGFSGGGFSGGGGSFGGGGASGGW